MDTIYFQELLEQTLEDIPSTFKIGKNIKENETIEWLSSTQEVIIEAFRDPNTFLSLNSIMTAHQKCIIESLDLLKKNLILFTNYAIYIYDNSLKISQTIEWWRTETVKYDRGYFKFVDHFGSIIGTIQASRLFPPTPDEENSYKYFAEGFTNVAFIAPNPLEIAEKNKYEYALKLIDLYIGIKPTIENYICRALIYYYKTGKTSKNIEELQKVLSLIEIALEENKECWKLHKYKGQILELMEKIIASRNAYMESLVKAPKDQKYELQKKITELEEANTDLWDNYVLKVPYKERKYIMLVEDSKIKNCAVSGITIFNSSNVPNCINFYENMPLNNELYVGHPYNPSVYIPYNQAEDILFQDKIQEFCYILQQLGAEEITITSLKGRKVNEINNKKEELEVAANAGRFGNASLNIDSSTSNLMDRTSHEQYDVKYVYDPIDMPKVPSETIWYQNQSKWQSIALSRIEGNTLECNECISSKSISFTTSSEKEDIKAKLKVLMANIEGRIYEEEEKQLREETETIWRVSVKFRSKKLLQKDTLPQPNSATALTNNEEEFLNEVRFCLDNDGIIDSEEQVYLDKVSQKLGLTQTKAQELQNSLISPQLTDNEKEYIETISKLTIDGKIPPSSQRIVERYRELYKVSSQRAEELELYINK
ncbi:hypothetical protein [Prevotella melaninogenica]|jgi:hypothetical protein|uniref:hypothetical protein n=1 Tax=Prevotella melaninogenica TaxID=28132 RepID=UPI001C5E0B6E|nr:hypothetical protein [Prevotella melaninogenica]MBW4899587.1 hypothetical protein [Prevotella melaninogenica]